MRNPAKNSAKKSLTTAMTVMQHSMTEGYTRGRNTQQDHDATESISDGNNAQKDWPRKCSQEDEKEPYESAMMCWESLDDSEQASKKRKTHCQDEETNDDKKIQANKMDDKTHNKCTTNMGKCLNIPVSELKLGADVDEKFSVDHEHSRKHTGCHEKCTRFQ